MTETHLFEPAAPLPSDASVLVVGAGLAGLRTAALLREHGHAGPVHLVGEEPHAAYDRPPLSKHLLDDGWHVDLGEDLGIDLRALDVDALLGTRVTRIDIDGEQFRAALVPTGSDGTDDELVVDAVVLATGSRARTVPGWEHALTLHTHDDAVRLRALLGGRERPRLVCIGAGWIGSEVAGVAAAAGADVTVVEAAPFPLASALGSDGALVAPWFAAAGVTLLTETAVAAVEPDGVILTDGRRFDADVVLAAVGARPAPLPDGSLTGMLATMFDGDVVVDSGMRPLAVGEVPDGLDLGSLSTADPYVTATSGPLARVRVVGDAAVRVSHRGLVRSGHWDAALTTPDLAVRALLDPTAVLADPVPYVFSTMLGHEVAMFGERPSGTVPVLRGDPAGDEGWAALWFVGEGPSSGEASSTEPSGTDLPDAELPDAGALHDPDSLHDAGATHEASATHDDGLRALAGILVVDRPRDVAAARRLFRAPSLPRLDPVRAADPTLPLR
ncbi:FAD-dependent oxidoreductase [Sanguibacter sp. HDW7]|uniref:FAD-dependent oxidoreductase n=1 Tax=Sanguibacter sp. HDW7 TaxID=2714931 RepID=UPI00140A6C51|nr:FAD-dependent oxidoreductase [Sanguibacter sp. HDW7]QIK82821.1 oxidoreductase [Sanguibacter sp. HDW7]